MNEHQKIAKKLYEMKLHDKVIFKSSHSEHPHIYVTRVIGGWIYDRINKIGDMGSVFVPFSNEFKLKENK